MISVTNGLYILLKKQNLVLLSDKLNINITYHGTRRTEEEFDTLESYEGGIIVFNKKHAHFHDSIYNVDVTFCKYFQFY